jgi:hypothetical protein
MDNGINRGKFHLKPRVGNNFGLTICVNEHTDVAVINTNWLLRRNEFAKYFSNQLQEFHLKKKTSKVR